MRAVTASAFLPACHAGQQRECSHTWPVGSTPCGCRASWALSAPPQARQLPDGERSRVRFSQSTTQHSKANASASGRASPPSNSAMPARSSYRARQSSTDQPSSPDLKSTITSALWRLRRSRTAAGGGADASRTRSTPSTCKPTPASRAARKAAAALIAVPSRWWCLFFRARIERHSLRPHRPQRPNRWNSKVWRGRY